jgi:hypothetical protein
MALEVNTKDCTSLGDADLAEMADLCADGGIPHEIGELSKQAEEWVLVTHAREGNKLRGFSFSTLERIGGTPCVLLGMASIRRNSKSSTVMRSIIADNFRRALMAFPDEDVLLGTRICSPGGFEAYKSLDDVVPRPGFKASGEDRAWGRRLAKRFGVPSSKYNDITFGVSGDGELPLVFDHVPASEEKFADLEVLFADLGGTPGDCLVAHGWIMAEDLVKYG